MDVFKFAYFPFVNAAATYVEALDFNLDELFTERAFEPIRERGKSRVLEAIGDGMMRSRNYRQISILTHPWMRNYSSFILRIILDMHMSSMNKNGNS